MVATTLIGSTGFRDSADAVLTALNASIDPTVGKIISKTIRRCMRRDRNIEILESQRMEGVGRDIWAPSCSHTADVLTHPPRVRQDAPFPEQNVLGECAQ